MNVDKAVTIRPPSTALLCVNSEDAKSYDSQFFRVDNNNPANIYINKQKPLMFGYMSRVALIEVNFEWSTPNVNETNNTLTLAIWDNTTNTLDGYRRIFITPGFYTLPELCKEIEAALNATVSLVFGYNLSWKVRWGQLVGTPTQLTKNFSINIELTDTDPTPRAAFQIVSSKVRRDAADTGGQGTLDATIDDITYMTGLAPVINFINLTSVPVQPYYNVIESAYPSLSYTPFVDIVSNLLTKNQNVSDDTTTKEGKNSILTRLYLSNQEIVQRAVTAVYDTPVIPGDPQSGDLLSSADNAIGVRPFTFRREFATPKQISWNRVENIDLIDLRVLDRLGNILFITPTAVTDEFATNQYIVTIGNDSDFQFTVSVTEA